MFNCCRCTNKSKKEKKGTNKEKVCAENNKNNDNVLEDNGDNCEKEKLEPQIRPDTENIKECNKSKNCPQLDKIIEINEKNGIINASTSSENKVKNKIDSINCENSIVNDKNCTSNTTNDSTYIISSNKQILNNIDENDVNFKNVPKNINEIINKTERTTTCLEDDKITKKPFKETSSNGFKYNNDFNVQYENEGEIPKSCMSRRSSSKSSIRKKVNINESTEVIPSSELPSIDDDEVFSDSIPPKMPRGDMCAPYIATKRGSFQGCVGYLPDWFNEDRFYATNEEGGILEPPVTPVGRDELALKRHRLYSELLSAAQAAVEHRVRFDPLQAHYAIPEDCDPDLNPSIAAELEKQVDRLEKLVERLERSVSANQLEIVNKIFDTKSETERRSFDIETAELPPIPNTSTDTSLNNRIDCLEESLNKIVFVEKNCKNNIGKNSFNDEDSEGSLENIPTVLDEYLIEEGFVESQESKEENLTEEYNMSVNGYEDIILGPLTQYLNVSNKIGGDVAKHASLVGKAFDAQFTYIKLATQISQPQPNKQMEFLKPTSDQIAAIQEFREKHRTSQYFNHLSAISESIPALGWVCVSPTPGPHVKEMNDAGQFYTNRVLKDWKDKDPSHVEWARSWIQTLTELQKYIKQYHTTGLVWSGKGQGSVPPPPPTGCPPPPPPPILDMSAMALDSNDDRNALFAEINRGEDVTKGLRKVTADMQTHKNPTLRTGPAPFRAPSSSSDQPIATKASLTKTPVFNRDGKKWIIEHQKSNPNLIIENAEMNNVIYMFKCENSTLTVKGKVNSVFFDSCKKCSLLVDSVVASIEFVNCQSVQMQVLHKCPTISIDKTDGCQMYLSKESLDVEIVSSKSSEMNVMIPKGNGDYVEQPIPEQYKTLIKGTALQTTCVESLG